MQPTKRHLSCLALMALALSPITAIDTQAQYRLTPFRPPGDLGFPVAINNSRTILTGSSFGQPGLLDGDSITPISIPNGFFPDVRGFNSHGAIVGVAYSDENYSSSFGFIQTKHGEVTLRNIPGFYTFPLGINNRGVVVGSAAGEDIRFHGFVWDSTGPRLFDGPGADFTELLGINDSGTVVGQFSIWGPTASVSQVFTLEGTRYSPLNIPGALSTYAGGINNRGEITGAYAVNDDFHRGFIYHRGVVTPVDYVLPEEDAPASFPPEPFDFGDGRSGTFTFVRASAFTMVTALNDRGDILGLGAAGYTPVVECGGCGATADDFFGFAIVDAFIGERDGSRTVHVKSAGKPQKFRVPPGKALQSLVRGR